MDKPALIDAFRARLEATLADLRATRDDARTGTRVDGTHRPANRGERAAVTSQGYLAAGLGQRIAEVEGLIDQVAVVDPGPRARVTVGALVLVADDRGERWLLVLPGGQGTKLDGGRVTVVSPESPLGRALAGLREGDAAERGDEEIEVLRVV